MVCAVLLQALRYAQYPNAVFVWNPHSNVTVAVISTWRCLCLMRRSLCADGDVCVM